MSPPAIWTPKRPTKLWNCLGVCISRATPSCSLPTPQKLQTTPSEACISETAPSTPPNPRKRGNEAKNELWRSLFDRPLFAEAQQTAHSAYHARHYHWHFRGNAGIG